MILDMEKLANKKPNQLSGREKQLAVRAFINEPNISMGDEPTGNFDKENSEIVFEINLPYYIELILKIVVLSIPSGDES